MNEPANIRPECLRPAGDFWVRPEANEVREVLRLGKLSGSKAAQLLGLGTGGSRTIRRYTGGDAAIPYPSWAILCELAGLGRIWRDDSDATLPNAPSEATSAASADGLSEVFNEAEQHVERIWTGLEIASVSAIKDCHDAFVRMKQVLHAILMRKGLSVDEQDVLEKRMAAAQAKVKTITSWVELP